MIKIYTDGSTRGFGTDNCRGAWGFIALDGDTVLMKTAAGVKDTTNQRMELSAAIEACKWAAAHCGAFTDIQIISDSAYLINCANQHWYEAWRRNGWRTSNNGDVKNKELWEQLIPYFDDSNYSFVKVRGHHGDKWNNEVDAMVQSITASMR